MKASVVASLALCMAGGAAAEAVKPLGDGSIVIAEYSSDVSNGLFGDKRTWSNFAPRETRFERTAEGQWLLADRSANLLIDPRTFIHTTYGAGKPKPEVVSESTTRTGDGIGPGMSWYAERVISAPVVNWCGETKASVASAFDVEPPESYTLKVDGAERAIQVFPVVEKGAWTRCYSGKRYTRYLVSRDLGAVVSVEHIGYSAQGRIHESSFRLNVREVRSQ